MRCCIFLGEMTTEDNILHLFLLYVLLFRSPFFFFIALKCYSVDHLSSKDSIIVLDYLLAQIMLRVTEFFVSSCYLFY